MAEFPAAVKEAVSEAKVSLVVIALVVIIAIVVVIATVRPR